MEVIVERGEDNKKRFIIIDGSSLMYRAFFALPLLTSSSGIYTNAIMGFANMLGKILTEYKPDNIVVAFDKSRQTFRTQMYAEYKGQREKTPDELKSQIPLLREFLEALGIAFIEKDNYEADDIIGTLATKAASQDYEALIVTGDKDALQLIRPNLKVMLTKRGIMDMQIFDEEAFKEKYAGLEPIKLIDIKALMGDSSDNIPGVPGIGEKTALKLLSQYQDLENLLNNIDNVSGKKLKEKLQENQELARLSYKLATICCEVDVDFKPQEFELTPNLQKLNDFCQKYELKTVLTRMKKVLADKLEVVSQNDDAELALNFEATMPVYEEFTQDKIDALISKIKAEKSVSFMVLFEGKVPDIFIDMMAICCKDSLGIIRAKEDIDKLSEVLQDETITKFVYDVKMLYHLNLDLKGKIYDTLLMAYLLEPAKRSYEMNVLWQMADIEEEIPWENLNEEEKLICGARHLADLSKILADKLADEKW